MTGKVVSSLAGGCLLLTTVVLLCFYVGHFIDIHQKELGILKALGYSRFCIAREFWTFGCSVLTGTASAYLCAHLLMPTFYEVQNELGLLPDFKVHFHPGLCLLLVFLPALFFSLLAVCYSYLKMKVSPLTLLRGKEAAKIVKARKESDLPFLQELGKSNVRQRKSLVFFITFAIFCFSRNDSPAIILNLSKAAISSSCCANSNHKIISLLLHKRSCNPQVENRG